MSYSYDRRKTARGDRLDPKLRSRVNQDLTRAGFGGRVRFRSMGSAMNAATGVLDKHGLELDDVATASRFLAKSGSTTFSMAFTNEADPFSPESINNSMLAIQWTELEPGRFEVIAYLS